MDWKKIALGVAAATVGAAAFGAVHFMFLAPQMGIGDLFGIPYAVLLPFLIGTLGFIGVYGFSNKIKGTIADILMFGSAAAIGFGIAQYAGWITPGPSVPGRANLRANLRVNNVFVPRSVPPAMLSQASSPGGTKLI